MYSVPHHTLAVHSIPFKAGSKSFLSPKGERYAERASLFIIALLFCMLVHLLYCVWNVLLPSPPHSQKGRAAKGLAWTRNSAVWSCVFLAQPCVLNACVRSLLQSTRSRGTHPSPLGLAMGMGKWSVYKCVSILFDLYTVVYCKSKKSAKATSQTA